MTNPPPPPSLQMLVNLNKMIQNVSTFYTVCFVAMSCAFSGKLDLAVGFRLNSTSPPGDQQAALGYLAGLTSAANPLLTATMLNLTHFFEISRQISLRRPHLTPQGLVLPMRASTRGALQCLWAEFEAGLLTERLQGIVAPNATLSQLGVPLFEVDVAIRREQYLVYSDVHIPYQGQCPAM